MCLMGKYCNFFCQRLPVKNMILEGKHVFGKEGVSSSPCVEPPFSTSWMEGLWLGFEAALQNCCVLPASCCLPSQRWQPGNDEWTNSYSLQLSVRDIPNIHYMCLHIRAQTKFGLLALKSQGIAQLSRTTISHVKYIQKKATFSTRLSLISLCSLKIL